MSKTKNIINNIKNNNDGEILPTSADYAKAQHIYEKIEEDKYRTETERQHNKWRSQQKKGVYIMQHDIRPAKKEVVKPGLQFEAPLKILAERYKDIETICKHFSMGQLSKYYTEGRKMYRHKDDKLVFDEETGECFE